MWIAVAEDAAAGPVRITGCFPVYDAFNFMVEHGRVTVTLTQSRWGAMPAPHMLSLGGGWQGNTLILEGREDGATPIFAQGAAAPVQHWTLRWDARREQLVGERDRKPIRLARLLLSSPPPNQCGSPPP
jgi:hypothetical protein